MRRLSISVAALFALQGLVGSAAAEQTETKIEIGFVVAFNQLQPEARSFHKAYSAEITLDGHQVREHWAARTVGGETGYHRDQGGLGGGAWRVGSGNEIIGRWRQGNFYKSAHVRVSGSQCSLSFDFQLLPGEQNYRIGGKGVTYVYSSMAVLDPYCRIR